MTPERIEELNRTAIDVAYIDSVAAQIEEPMSGDENCQLRALEVICNRLGLRDAGDFLRYRREANGNPKLKYLPHQIMPTPVCDLKEFPQVQTVLADQIDAAILIAQRFRMEKASEFFNWRFAKRV